VPRCDLDAMFMLGIFCSLVYALYPCTRVPYHNNDAEICFQCRRERDLFMKKRVSLMIVREELLRATSADPQGIQEASS